MSCSSGKIQHLSHVSARRFARAQMLRQKNVILNVYRCEECRLWHITSSHTQRTLREANYLGRKRMVEWP